VLLLSASKLFMIIACYGHLKHLNTAPWWIAALVSWGIALFESCCSCRPIASDTPH
jgi:uncharacterized protein (DUF486 family)